MVCVLRTQFQYVFYMYSVYHEAKAPSHCLSYHSLTRWRKPLTYGCMYFQLFSASQHRVCSSIHFAFDTKTTATRKWYKRTSKPPSFWFGFSALPLPSTFPFSFSISLPFSSIWMAYGTRKTLVKQLKCVKIRFFRVIFGCDSLTFEMVLHTHFSFYSPFCCS